MKTIRNLIQICSLVTVLMAPSAQGQVQWAKRIASTTNTDDELAIGMTLDTNGNCYVTGWFDGTNDFGGVTLINDSGGGQDIFVAKYDPNGALQWAHRAGGSSASRAMPGAELAWIQTETYMLLVGFTVLRTLAVSPLPCPRIKVNFSSPSITARARFSGFSSKVPKKPKRT